MENRVVFFDLGNTLARSGDLSARRLLGHRLNLTEKEVKQVGRLIMTSPAADPQSLATELECILKDQAPQRILEAVRAVWQQQMEQFALLPGACEVLDRLKGMSFRLGLLSNMWHPIYEALLSKASDVLEYFDHLVLSYRVGFKKPSLSIFELAIETAGVAPHRCWMVGDSYELDLDPAMKAGMRTVWVLSRPEAEKGFLAEILRRDKPLPDNAVEHLRDLPQVMDMSYRTGEV
jgi:HAD superfamily hydrolase (TIGR01549 family)